MSATATMPSRPRFSRLSDNVMPFSKVRNNLADCIKRTRTTHVPIIITQNGCATSVLADLKDLEDFMEMQEIREAVRIGDEQIACGKTLPHEQVMREMDAMLDEMEHAQ